MNKNMFSDIITVYDAVEEISDSCEDDPCIAGDFIKDILAIQTREKTIGRVEIYENSDAVIRSMQWFFQKHNGDYAPDCIDMLLDELEDWYLPSDTQAITVAEVGKTLEKVDALFPYSKTILKAHPLILMVFDTQHNTRNAESSAIFTADGMHSAIRFYRQQADAGSPYFILLHELGHLLHMYLTQSIDAVPDSFRKFLKLLGASDSELSGDMLPELFADAFLMAVSSKFGCLHDPFTKVRTQVKEACFEYMHSAFQQMEMQP